MLVTVAVLAASCGGKSAAPGVASLTNAGTTTTTASAGGGGPFSHIPAGTVGHVAMALALSPQDGAKFAACMRKNGVPNFPDPNGQGEILIGPSSGIDPGSPKFQSAQGTCRKLLRNGGRPTPAQIAKAQQAALEFSKCMRTHGVPDFPDPTFSTGGGIRMKLQVSGALNPSNPTFQAAQKACRGTLGPKGLLSTSAGPK
jgi:hypothetical protein